jgi:hypothetical protein
MTNHRTIRPGQNGTLGPILLKGGSRLLLGVTVILVFLTLVQCSIEKPESPQWTTSIVVPVMNRTYDMEEIITKIDQDGLTMNDDGIIAYSFSEDLDTVSLSDDNLSITNVTYSINKALGNIAITAPTVAPVTATLSSISGLPGAIVAGVLPAMNFNVTNAMPAIDNFTTATVSSGLMNCVVANDLGVALDVMTISIYDASVTPNVLITTGTFPATIDAGTTATLPLDLAGKTLSNQLEVRAACHTPGGAVVNIAQRDIQTDLNFVGDLLVSAATAKVPAMDPIVFYSTSSLDLAAGESVSSASLNGGSLDLVITNNTNIASGLIMAIPQLTLNETVYSIDTTIAANDSIVLSTDLTGYVLAPTSNSVSINTAATVSGSGDALVEVAATDGFTVEASLADLSFASVTGIFASSEATFDDVEQDLDVPDGFGEITLNSATLTLEIENAVDQPGSLAITMTGSNGKTLNLSGDMAASGAVGTAITTITNTDVADFISPMPETITISGSISFGDGTYEGTLTPNDWVAASISIYAPLDVSIDSAIVDDMELQSVDIDQEDIDQIVDNVVSASFSYTMDSHLPLGVNAVITISGDSASLFLEDLAASEYPILQLEPIAVDPAPVSLATGTGVVSESLISSGSLTLDNDDIQILKNETVFVRTRLILTSSDTSGVQLMAEDYVTVSGSFNVEYFFDGEF